jgi:hypothetical protein
MELGTKEGGDKGEENDEGTHGRGGKRKKEKYCRCLTVGAGGPGTSQKKTGQLKKRCG